MRIKGCTNGSLLPGVQSASKQAKGRTKKLSQNYRNTQQILSAAWDTLQPSITGVEENATFTPAYKDIRKNFADLSKRAYYAKLFQLFICFGEYTE
jgi:hypothetical protein